MPIERSLLSLPFRSLVSQRALPMLSLTAPQSGPTVWLVAGLHGDEVGGTVVVQELFTRLQAKGLRRGTLFALPLTNPFGFEVASRHVPISEEDLNRAFPGNPDGTFAERIAAFIFQEISTSKPALVLDLHNDWIHSVPYALIDPKPDAVGNEVYSAMESILPVLDMPVVRDRHVFKGTLSYELLCAGVPALSLELGESYVINEANVQLGVEALWSVLQQLEMVEGEVPAQEHALEILEYSDQPRASAAGIARFLVKPGDMVKADQPLAEIYDVLGERQEVLTAAAEALVLGYADYSVVFPGTPLMSFGVK